MGWPGADGEQQPFVFIVAARDLPLPPSPTPRGSDAWEEVGVGKRACRGLPPRCTAPAVRLLTGPKSGPALFRPRAMRPAVVADCVTWTELYVAAKLETSREGCAAT